MTAKKHLDGRGKGQYSYDYSNDVLIFKIKNRDYLKSVEFENLVVDIDTKGFITGLRIFDASKIFKLSKFALQNVKNFKFDTNVEDNVVSIRLMFTPVLRNKSLSTVQRQNFVRESHQTKIENAEVLCTVP